MPITNDGRIYIDTTTTPHKGVSIADIQTALRTGARNTIGGLIRYAYDNNLIKTYAKYKPFRDASFNPTDETRRTKNYGLYIPWYNQIGKMVSDIYADQWDNAENYDANRTPWGWEPPRGFAVTPKEPFRFLDFNRYYANAQAFVGQVPSPVTIPVSERAITLLWPYVYDSQALAPSDLIPYNSLDNVTRYLGVCLCTGANANQRRVYTTYDVSHFDDSTIRLIQGDWNPAPRSQILAFLFISDRQIAIGDTEVNGEYIPILPSISLVSEQIEEWKLRNLSVVASQLGQNVTVSWSVDLQNTGGTTATVECHYYYLDGNDQEQEFTPSYSAQASLTAGTNTGNCNKSNVTFLLSRVVVSIAIVDSLHGNDYISKEELLNQI